MPDRSRTTATRSNALTSGEIEAFNTFIGLDDWQKREHRYLTPTSEEATTVG